MLELVPGWELQAGFGASRERPMALLLVRSGNVVPLRIASLPGTIFRPSEFSLAPARATALGEFAISRLLELLKIRVFRRKLRKLGRKPRRSRLRVLQISLELANGFIRYGVLRLRFLWPNLLLVRRTPASACAALLPETFDSLANALTPTGAAQTYTLARAAIP